MLAKRCFTEGEENNGYVFANEYERIAFEKVYHSIEVSYILGKAYRLGCFGLFDVAHIHIDEQGPQNPAAMPLVSKV